MATFNSGVDAMFIQPSDLVGQSVVITPAALSASYAPSAAVDVRDFRQVDWGMLITNVGTGPITRIDVQWEFSDVASPASTDWMALQTESITGGVSTPATYEVQQPLSGAAPITKIWTTVSRGRWMRILVKAGVGTPTSSVIALTALRRA